MKKKLPPRIATLAFVLTLAGCAFFGGPVGSPPPLQHPQEAGTLRIYRTASLVGLFGTMHVELNGHDLYRLGMSQSYNIRLDPGGYILTYTIGLNDCSAPVTISPKQTTRLRLLPDCMIEYL